LSPKEQFKILNYVLRVKAFMLRQKARHAFSGNPRNQPAAMNNAGRDDVCKKLSSLTECSQELFEHNRKLGYF